MTAEIQRRYLRRPNSYEPTIRHAPDLSGIPMASSAHHLLGFERMPPWPPPPSMPRIRQSRVEDGRKPLSRLCVECSMRLSATGCDRPPPSSGTLNNAQRRRHNRRATHNPRSFVAAGAKTFDRRGDRTGRISGRRVRSHRRALSAARSQHRQRGNPGIFHRPQQKRLLGCP